MFKKIKVNNYKINLNIDIENLKYNGYVTIDIELNSFTNIIEINSSEILISKILINDINYNFESDTENELIKINGNFSKGNYKINIKFYNIINDLLDGFFYLKDKEYIIVSTHLEPTSARKFIPCFDVPYLKATFDIEITIGKKFTGISNTDIKHKSYNDILQTNTIIFEQTPIMATYLLCISVGDIVPLFVKPLISKNNIKINGYCFPDRVEYLKWSIDHVVKALEYFETWFDIKYPLTKLDVVSLPNFSAGAMENWGLIVFKEEYLLLYNKSDWLTKVKILEVIYHEMAHQWFGNLVTLDDWNNLWLNESTATYFAWMALKDVYTDLNIPELYLFLEYNNLYQIDGITHTHSIIPSESSITPVDIFDEITYEKGCTIIYYISGLMSGTNFQESIRNYLKSNMYKNTNSEELYKNFNIFSNKNNLLKNKIDYGELTNKMIRISGYPILFVEKKLNNQWEIKIKKFNLDKNKISNYESDLYVKIVQQEPDLDSNLNTITYNMSSEQPNIYTFDKPFYINPSNELFCIINWTNSHPSINIMTQSELITYVYEEFILNLYGYKKLSDYLKTIENIINSINIEKYYLLMYKILTNLNRLFEIYDITSKSKSKSKSISTSNSNYNIFYNFVNTIVKIKLTKLFEKYLINFPKYLEMVVDQILILFCINLEDLDMINLSKKLFLEQINNVNINFSKSLNKIMIKHFSNKTFSILFNENKFPIENNHVIESLEYIDSEHFDYIFTNYKNIIKKQDYLLFFKSLSKNKNYQQIIIDYYIDNIDTIILNNELKFKILKAMSFNIFNKKYVEKILNFIKNSSKKERFISNKITNILETNLIIENNL